MKRGRGVEDVPSTGKSSNSSSSSSAAAGFCWSFGVEGSVVVAFVVGPEPPSADAEDMVVGWFLGWGKGERGVGLGLEEEDNVCEGREVCKVR